MHELAAINWMGDLAAFTIGFSVTFFWRYYRRLGQWRPMI